MKKFLISISSISVYFIFFSTSFAASTQATCSMAGLTTLKDIIMRFVIGCILTNLVVVIVGLAIFIFLWGILKFLTSAGDDKQAGRELMFWGIIGIFVMLSLWGLVNVLKSTFTLSNNDITPRQVNIPGL